MCTESFCDLTMFLYAVLISITVVVCLYATKLLPRFIPALSKKWYDLGYVYMYIIIDSVINAPKDKGFLLQPFYQGMRDCLKGNRHLLSDKARDNV